MKFSELIQKDRDLLKDKSLKEKLRHIWLYYKWYFGAALLLIIYVASTIYSNVSAANCVLSGIFLNPTGTSYAVLELGEDFLSSSGLDTDGQEVYFDTMYYSSDPDAEDATSVYETFQLLIAKAHSGELDFLVTGSDTVSQLIYNEFFLDLPQVLSPLQAEAYEPHFLYMDKAFLEKLSNGLPDSPLSYPDPTKPELMEEPVPVLVNISASQGLGKLYPESTDLYALGFVVGGEHTDTALTFLDHLMKPEENP